MGNKELPSSLVSFIFFDNHKEYYGMGDMQDYLRYMNIPDKSKYTTRTGTITFDDGDIFTCKNIEDMTDEEMTIVSMDIVQGCIEDYNDTLLHYLAEHSAFLKAHFLINDSDELFKTVKEYLHKDDDEHDEDEDEPVELTLREGIKVHADARNPEWIKIK